MAMDIAKAIEEQRLANLAVLAGLSGLADKQQEFETASNKVRREAERIQATVPAALAAIQQTAPAAAAPAAAAPAAQTTAWQRLASGLPWNWGK